MGLSRRIKHFLRRLRTAWLVAGARRRTAGIRRCGRPAEERGPVRLVLFLSRPQDVDLYLDIYHRARERPEIEIMFWSTRRALEHFPVMPGLLEEHGITVDLAIDHQGLGRVEKPLRGVDALLNTVESSFAAHKVPHCLVQIANACGVMTYTLQHGFENLGLTYLDEERGSGVTFASRRVLCWGRVAELPGRLAADTMRKCVAVGCPKSFPEKVEKPVPAGESALIAVFEGLHAGRFDADYCRRFFADLALVADEFKQFRFILKPHPGIIVRRAEHQRGLDRLAEKIEVLDPSRPEKSAAYSTPELLGLARAVITTPSTIALDAARVRVPVAVLRYGQQISYYDLYRPLPLLDTIADWRAFLTTVAEAPAVAAAPAAAFSRRVMLPGSAARRILDLVISDCRGAGRRRPEVQG